MFQHSKQASREPRKQAGQLLPRRVRVQQGSRNLCISMSRREEMPSSRCMCVVFASWLVPPMMHAFAPSGRINGRLQQRWWGWQALCTCSVKRHGSARRWRWRAAKRKQWFPPRGAGKPSYEEQGEGTMNTDEALAIRQLRRHPDVVNKLQVWWDTAQRSMRIAHGNTYEASMLARDEYIKLCSLFRRR